MFAACPSVRVSLLYDGRCLTAGQAAGDCGVELAPCAAAGEANHSLQYAQIPMGLSTGDVLRRTFASRLAAYTERAATHAGGREPGSEARYHRRQASI